MDRVVDPHEVEVSQNDVASTREFGWVFAVFFLILYVILARPSWHTHSWLLFASLLTVLLTLFFPRVLRPFSRLWQSIGLLLNSMVSPIVLAALFFLMITPIGLLLRLRGFDPLRLRFDRDAASYWIERNSSAFNKNSFKDQF